jgi:predicted ATP-grasp superfamily ATP-dependent carboligase
VVRPRARPPIPLWRRRAPGRPPRHDGRRHDGSARQAGGGGTSLFALHLAACAGTLPEHPPALDAAAAGAIVYAERDVTHMPALAWPDWTADRPVPASSVGSDGPLCTVFAAARTAHEARQRVERRAARILVALDASLP